MRAVVGRCALALAGGLVGLLLSELLVRAVFEARAGTARDHGGLERAYQRHDPLLGWRPVPGVVTRHHTTEFDVTYAIGAHGFRQREPPFGPSRRADGSPRPRVLALGDSFVFGQGVDEQARFTERLAESLDVDVFAAGIPGSGTDQQLLLLHELWPLPGPAPRALEAGARGSDGAGRDAARDGAHGSAGPFDVVVLGLLLEAVERNVAERRAGRAKPRFVFDPDGLLTLTGVPVPDDYLTPAQRALLETSVVESVKATLRRHSALYGLLRRRFRDDLRAAWSDASAPGGTAGGTATADDPDWPVTRALLALVDDAVGLRGARLLVVVIPAADDLDTDRGRARAARVLEACAERGVPAVDLVPVLERTDGAYFPVDGHWTERGHRVAAEAIGPALDALLVPR